MRTIYIAYCMLRELNHRLTGVSREASPATTMFVTGVLAGALRSAMPPVPRPFTRLRAVRPSLPAACAALATGRYITSTVAGEPLRETPHANLAIALGFVRPVLGVMALPVELVRAVRAGASTAWRWLSTTARERTA